MCYKCGSKTKTKQKNVIYTLKMNERENDDDSNIFCKLCLKTYQNAKESRRNLSKSKDIIQRLKIIGLEFDHIGKKETICRKCDRDIIAIEKKDSIRDSWVRNVKCKRRKVDTSIISNLIENVS